VLRKAAQDGDSIARLALGHKLMKDGKYSEAISWLGNAARAGSLDAQFLIGLVTIFHKSNQKDLADVWPEIRQFINDSGVKNIPFAQWILGESVPSGDFGYKKDKKLGYNWSSRAASNGLCLAMATMAKKDYLEGEWEKSLQWYLRLADKGEVVSKYCAACLLARITTLDSNDGASTKQKLLQARELLNDCKANGMWMDQALDFLAMLSDDKHPTILLDPKKKPRDIDLLGRIAKTFDPGFAKGKDAYWDYVVYKPKYIFGEPNLLDGICLSWFVEERQRNTETAMKWYRFAAESGDTDAATVMGIKFWDGKGVQLDAGEAKK